MTKRHRPQHCTSFIWPRLLVLLALILSIGQVGAAERRDPYGFTFTAIEGTPLKLEDYRGKALLVVNTASLCGFTYQYTALQRLWEKYRDRGLVVLGVPSNDFGRQEPGTSEEIKTFCEANFDVDFPMTEKVVVRGAKAHPLFAWFKETLGPGGEPQWNFHKYLISPEGKLLAAWGSTVEPDSQAIRAKIEPLLRPSS